jgi:hypothetical protein
LRHDQRGARRAIPFEERRDHGGRHVRHVGEDDDDRVRVMGGLPHARVKGRVEATRVVRVQDGATGEPVQLGPDAGLLVSEHDDHAVHAGFGGGAHGATNQRLATELEQQLVPSHARGRAGGKHDGGDHQRFPCP